MMKTIVGGEWLLICEYMLCVFYFIFLMIGREEEEIIDRLLVVFGVDLRGRKMIESKRDGGKMCITKYCVRDRLGGRHHCYSCSCRITEYWKRVRMYFHII